MTDWRPTATRRALEVRADLARRVRAFFDRRGLLEVETPALSRGAPTDPHIHGLHAEVAGHGRRWLQTSPEFPMKRLLAAGHGDCWQLCRVFRDGEAGRLHNPEFTLLEWYRVGWDDHRLMDEVDELLRAALDGYRELGPATRTRYEDVLPAGSGDVDDLTLGTVVTPRLGHGAPCFVTDWPASRAALARVREDDPRWAARFEAFVDGMELANGYHELADAAEQRRRFDADNAARRAAGLPEMPLDEGLLAALASGLPDCAGVALGFDRLVMLALGATDIREALAFPIDRA